MMGVIIVNKEENMSSHDVVAKLRKVFQTKKVGHCGTLDPSATGILVCLLNNATKLSNYLVLDTKEYVATFKLGQATTTQDLEGEVVEQKKYLNEYSKTDIAKVVQQFQGKMKQTPSIYSAIKVNGKKLYEYARNGEEVTIPTREIEISKIELIDFYEDLVTIKVNCSSGTYIRTLCFDIARQLGYPGVLTTLERTQSGAYTLDDSFSLAQIAAGEYKLWSIAEALSDFEQVVVSEAEVGDIKNGKPIDIETDRPFVVLYLGEALALYGKSNNGQAKMLRGLW